MLLKFTSNNCKIYKTETALNFHYYSTLKNMINEILRLTDIHPRWKYIPIGITPLNVLSVFKDAYNEKNTK